MPTEPSALDDYTEALVHLSHEFDQLATRALSLEAEDQHYGQAETLRAAAKRARLTRDVLFAESFYDTARKLFVSLNAAYDAHDRNALVQP